MLLIEAIDYATAVVAYH